MFFVSGEIFIIMIVALIILGIIISFGIIFEITQLVIYICKHFKNKEKK